VGSYVTDDDRADFTTAMGDTDEAEPVTPDAPPEEEDTPDEGEPGTGDSTVEADEEAAGEQSEATSDEATFTVRVDGQDVELPQSELVNGYLRQSDYTRKVQRLAVDRQRLAEAELVMQKLEVNPAATLAVLAQHYGVQGYDGDGEPITGPSPEQQQLAQLQAWQAGELQRQKEAAVDAEVARLHQEYGEFSDDDLFGFAVEHQVADLETALRAMTFKRTTPSRTAEKRKVAAMAGGQGTNGVARPKAPAESISSFSDAYEAAKRELSG
jgi:hypothetical protein